MGKVEGVVVVLRVKVRIKVLVEVVEVVVFVEERWVLVLWRLGGGKRVVLEVRVELCDLGVELFWFLIECGRDVLLVVNDELVEVVGIGIFSEEGMKL